jgi:hypothetical protein
MSADSWRLEEFEEFLEYATPLVGLEVKFLDSLDWRQLCCLVGHYKEVIRRHICHSSRPSVNKLSLTLITQQHLRLPSPRTHHQRIQGMLTKKLSVAQLSNSRWKNRTKERKM